MEGADVNRTKPAEDANWKQSIGNDPDGYYAWNYKQAKDNGDVSAAKELLNGFCNAVAENSPPSPIIVDYLALAFEQYLQGKLSIDKALLLRPRTRGRKKGKTSHTRPEVVVAYMYLLMKRDHMNKSQAKASAGEKFCIGTREIERYDKEWNLIRNFDLEELTLLANLKRDKK